MEPGWSIRVGNETRGIRSGWCVSALNPNHSIVSGETTHGLEAHASSNRYWSVVVCKPLQAIIRCFSRSGTSFEAMTVTQRINHMTLYAFHIREVPEIRCLAFYKPPICLQFCFPALSSSDESADFDGLSSCDRETQEFQRSDCPRPPRQ